MSSSNIDEVYARLSQSEVDTTRISPHQMVKEVARIIHTGAYQEADLEPRLVDIKDGRYP